ncbi:MAG: KAP family NTPase [Actinobacteria bacterium]|nr:KAP family NTPase [Actinomycetota bacterium]
MEQPALLPLTVGVTGEWGSGKSSLVAMAHARLKGKYVRQAATFSSATLCPSASSWVMRRLVWRSGSRRRK